MEKAAYKKVSHFRSRLMERFALTMNGDELRTLIFCIQNYQPLPVYITEDAMRSFHPITFKGETVVIVYDWEFDCPVTVYRDSWFNKISETEWIPIRGKYSKAKVRRYRERKRAFVQKESPKVRREFFISETDPLEKT
jgi:hypothetical protein